MSFAPSKCPSCGYNVQTADAKFCMKCGNELLPEKVESRSQVDSYTFIKPEVDSKTQILHIRAEQYLSENNLEEAEVIYKKIIDESDPYNEFAWWGLFKIAHGNFNIEIEDKSINEVIANAGGIEKIDFNSLYENQTNREWIYAMKYASLAQREQYSNEFNSYITRRIAALYVDRGLNYTEKHKYKLGIADFTEAIKLQPEQKNVYWYRGLAYYEKEDDYIAAIADFTKCIENDSSDADYYEMRGKCYYLIDRYDLAVVDLNKAIELGCTDEIVLNLRNKALRCSRGEVSKLSEKELLKKVELCLKPKTIILVGVFMGVFLSLSPYLYDSYELNTLIAEKNVKKIVEKMDTSEDPKKFTEALIKIKNNESLGCIKSRIASGNMSYTEEQRLYAIKMLKENRIELPGEIDFSLIYSTSPAENAKNEVQNRFKEANSHVAKAYLDYLIFMHGADGVVAEYISQIRKAPLMEDGTQGLVNIVLNGDDIIALADYSKKEKFNELRKIVVEIEPFVKKQGELHRKLEFAKEEIRNTESQLENIGERSSRAYYTSEKDRLYKKALYALGGIKDKEMIDASDPSALPEAQRKDFEKQKRANELFQKRNNMVSELRQVNEELSSMSRINSINFLLAQVQNIIREL